LARDARLWLRAHRYGLLSTHSTAVAGYPFGSVVPYVLDHDGCPVLLISRLAEHTKNLAANPHTSLLTHEQGPNVQAQARVTLVGKAECVQAPDTIEARYTRYFPDTAGYRTRLDFDFWRIVPVTLRAIAGFAKVHWLSREAYAPPSNTLASEEADIIEHMNTDHTQTLRSYCRLQGMTATEAASMTGLDCDGFDVSAGGASLRFTFDEPVTNAHTARAALVALADRARAS
jgi:putative heme iron utilization protein